ncbi:MAG: phage holin family protein, partial [Mycobacterium sp.]|nr:phage holin family protein [Mycobacterium sp.]
FFFFLFVAELLDMWLWRWVAYLIVFGAMVFATAVLALLGFLRVRRIRGPRQTIESVKEARTALTPGHDKAGAGGRHTVAAPGPGENSGSSGPADTSGW